ncbi:MAG: DUF948 domain-containing protein [Kineosporiaceae bacterium]|nr:DUF948 domain-containing protein [Kineosporiaceae bacterium]MBK7625055.1 DUF948 domain-containing protein [Kineosporiaceae bacterium]MBK8076564.1 DUF948 domain-containing protein [Kineosporiaceae bacterium]
MDVGDVALLIIACAFLLLVGFLGVPLIKLGRVLDETRLTVRGVSDGTTPLLSEVTTTVATTNQQLTKVDTITSNVAQVSTNISALTSLFAATLGSPVVKVAAFSYGVRQAVNGRKARDARRATR